ncbi:uncharacterized protein N7500_005526 [Penicillium coprophilum]|uniref:uncharacterized protein n=1 Tax=Penicillium coprophilum TaxID=36646 RepID=UPI0023A1B9FC|nr:uncharacterized protein N7500_005526 [Penicillium coprophilum]KAJ5163696.1 hypothetical protein N7500_005526 [Penicillium coprophilum]
MNSIVRDILPDDTVFPEDLLELGFVITDDDTIRYVGSPDHGPRFKINRSARINKAHIEALHKAIRTIVIDRLVGMGMHFKKISMGSKRHVPILVSGNVYTASRVVVFCGEIIEDLGIFSYRDVCDDGVSFGSILAFAKALLGENAQNSPNALIIANAGHNIWYNSGWYAVTEDSYHGHHCSPAVDRERQLSPRNTFDKGGIVEHIRNIFEGILIRNNFEVDAKIDVIGLSEGGHAAITYLKSQWSFWFPNVSSLSLINPETIAKTDTNIEDLNDPKSFSWFMKYRCRGWVICDKPIGTRVPGLNHLHGGCNTYSSGEGTKSSCMVTRGVTHILTWMNVMYLCPAAMEKFDVIPGETDLNSKMISASLGNNIELTDDEVEMRTSLNHLKSFLTGVMLTDKMTTFFKDKHADEMASFANDNGDNDDTSSDSEASIVDGVEEDDEYDIRIDSIPGPSNPFAPAVPSALHDNFVSSALRDNLPVTASDAPIPEGDRAGKEDGYDNRPDLVTGPSDMVAPAIPSAIHDDLVSSALCDNLPVLAAEALVSEGAHYDDVIRGQTGPFDLSDLQNIREEVEEE